MVSAIRQTHKLFSQVKDRLMFLKLIIAHQCRLFLFRSSQSNLVFSVIVCLCDCMPRVGRIEGFQYYLWLDPELMASISFHVIKDSNHV